MNYRLFTDIAKIPRFCIINHVGFDLWTAIFEKRDGGA